MLEREQDRPTDRPPPLGAAEAGAPPPLTPWVRLDGHEAALPDEECTESAPLDEAYADEAGDAPPSDERGWRDADPAPRGPRRPIRRRTSQTVAAEVAVPRQRLTPAQRLLALDTWQLSGLDGTEFAALVGVSSSTLYDWKRKFAEDGPAGLEDRPRDGRSDKRLSEAVRRAILMTKKLHPDWGSERIHHQMARTDGLSASPGAIQRVLADAGYVVEKVATARHELPVHRFERAKPNELWQSDLFTFVLRRQNQRVHLVAFLDDHSRGIRQIVARPRHPQTLGKTERMWGTLWRELLETAVFRDLDEARSRLGWFFDYYNFQRSHQGIDGLVPADRYFAAAPEVAATLRQRVATNALDLAQHGVMRKPFYLTGRVGDMGVVSLHAEGERVILVGEDGVRAEVDLAAPGRRAEPGTAPPAPPLTTNAAPVDHPATQVRPELAPGASPVDAALAALRALGDPIAAPKPAARPAEESVQ